MKKDKLGFAFSHDAVRQFPNWQKTNLAKSILASLFNTVSVLLLGGIHWTIFQHSLATGLAIYIAISILITRQLRGQENLVHEAAHYNWSRRKRVNDCSANLLSAVPVFATVRGFRASHNKPHHEHFGMEDDPCFRRYVHDLDLEGLDRRSLKLYIRGIVRRIFPYIRGWWIGPAGISRKSLLLGILWHVLVVFIPVCFVAGAPRALALWALYFGVPFFVLLPPFRFIAEAAKHHYINSDGTVFVSTFNNTGSIHWLFHPHGDGLHLLHHLNPNFPHHRLRKVDKWLSEYDAVYAQARCRKHLLDSPAIPNLSSRKADQ